MTHDAVRALCLAQPGATEDTPFGPDTLVFRIEGKMFALLSLDAHPPRVALKCDPETAVELRERYDAVQGAYHMNKRHWNSVRCDGTVPRDELEGWVADSYRLVVNGLPKALRAKWT